ncbi:hypothetical protein CkaCkLH20_09354 [Colletotrichum karsti]|uniref:Cyanovirin-N domain-containing protein n=1 Tax=Colletotrichum karsti TaxID=1095194 RepID=A0A9P6I1L1_9PEZI|nr:uncharacterized protein CkaCkLH20_09354 [Colletotrichum karsti]KAF9873191.1 hypothetical protein CkaCkLH20_09354 [Colletotrichum karsti]
MKLLSIAALASLAATSVMGGNCPKESTCIQEECSNFQISKHVRTAENVFEETNLGNPILEADCIDRHGTKVFTWLKLKQCLVNRKGQMYWGYNGNSNCRQCSIKERKSNSDPVIMSCWCPDGKTAFTEINLSEGIWHYDGVIGCFAWDGHKQPIAPVKKRSVPEIPAEAAVEARDIDDLSARDPGLTDDPVGANHHRTPAEPRDNKIPSPPIRAPWPQWPRIQPPKIPFVPRSDATVEEEDPTIVETRGDKTPSPPIRAPWPQWPRIQPRKVTVSPRSDDVVDEEPEDVEVGGTRRFRRF